ncbi:MAG: sensor histidine kinase [Acidimicrobiales bacterium]
MVGPRSLSHRGPPDARRVRLAQRHGRPPTPLAGLQTLLEVALADPDVGTETLRSTCEKALVLSQHQERLVNVLLALATSERGVEVWESFDLAQITDTNLTARRHDADHQGIHIQASLPAAPATGDPKLVDLLVATLTDTDTGPTVPPSRIDRLFQPFQQASTERVGHTDGHGFGLAIVGAIAKGHHAKITARSRPDGGLEIA